VNSFIRTAHECFHLAATWLMATSGRQWLSSAGVIIARIVKPSCLNSHELITSAGSISCGVHQRLSWISYTAISYTMVSPALTQLLPDFFRDRDLPVAVTLLKYILASLLSCKDSIPVA
jgi:hypothetical protein